MSVGHRMRDSKAPVPSGRMQGEPQTMYPCCQHSLPSGLCPQTLQKLQPVWSSLPPSFPLQPLPDPRGSPHPSTPSSGMCLSLDHPQESSGLGGRGVCGESARCAGLSSPLPALPSLPAGLSPLLPESLPPPSVSRSPHLTPCALCVHRTSLEGTIVLPETMSPG